MIPLRHNHKQFYLSNCNGVTTLYNSDCMDIGQFPYYCNVSVILDYIDSHNLGTQEHVEWLA